MFARSLIASANSAFHFSNNSIANELPVDFNISHLPDKRAIREIVARTKLDFTQEADGDAQHAVLIEQLEKLHGTFSHRFRDHKQACC